MRACGATCGHKQFVLAYREELQRHEIAGENASLGYAEELRDYLVDHPKPLYKQWLIHTKREVPEMTQEWEIGADPLRTATSFLKFDTPREANEAYLLGSAMYSEAGVDALRVISPQEFGVPFHADVAKAIVYQANRGEPHDAATVSSMLREAGRLPRAMDPEACLVTVDSREYGLGAWETYAPGPAQAPGFAQAVRSEYRARYLEEACVTTAALARGAIEYDVNGLPDNDLVGHARMTLAERLVAMPKELGPDLKERASTGSSANVETWSLKPSVNRKFGPVEMPPPPMLSPAGRAVVSR